MAPHSSCQVSEDRGSRDDLRVDDDPEPVVKLQGLVAGHHVFFGTSQPEDRLPIDEHLARELQQMSRAAGHYSGDIHGAWDEASVQAFWALVGNENLEERWNIEETRDTIDRVALDYLRSRFPS